MPLKLGRVEANGLAAVIDRLADKLPSLAGDPGSRKSTASRRCTGAVLFPSRKVSIAACSASPNRSAE